MEEGRKGGRRKEGREEGRTETKFCKAQFNRTPVVSIVSLTRLCMSCPVPSGHIVECRFPVGSKLVPMIGNRNQLWTVLWICDN